MSAGEVESLEYYRARGRRGDPPPPPQMLNKYWSLIYQDNVNA